MFTLHCQTEYLDEGGGAEIHLPERAYRGLSRSTDLASHLLLLVIAKCVAFMRVFVMFMLAIVWRQTRWMTIEVIETRDKVEDNRSG